VAAMQGDFVTGLLIGVSTAPCTAEKRSGCVMFSNSCCSNLIGPGSAYLAVLEQKKGEKHVKFEAHDLKHGRGEKGIKKSRQKKLKECEVMKIG
jgi:hypothetical protein